jgi:hypothetical protein
VRTSTRPTSNILLLLLLHLEFLKGNHAPISFGVLIANDPAAGENSAVLKIQKKAGIAPTPAPVGAAPAQSDKISHIDIQDDRIDTVLSHIIRPYPMLISRMTISIW